MLNINFKIKKSTLIIGSFSLLFVGLIIITIIFITGYRNNLAKESARKQILTQIENIQSELSNLQELSIDNVREILKDRSSDLYSQSKDNHDKLVNSAATLKSDIIFNENLLSNLTSIEAQKLEDYITKIRSLVDDIEENDINYDKFLSFFDENSDYVKASSEMSELYSHKIETIEDLKDIVQKYDEIIEQEKKILKKFNEIKFFDSEETYRVYINDFIDALIAYLNQSKTVFQEHIDTNQVPDVGFYELLKEASDEYVITYKALDYEYSSDIENDLDKKSAEISATEDIGEDLISSLKK